MCAFLFISVILQVAVIQIKKYVMKPVIVHLMGNNNFANLLVIHTGGVKVVVTLKMIAGDRNFFANRLKYHAMTHVNVSSYIYDTLQLINGQNYFVSWFFHGHIFLLIDR